MAYEYLMACTLLKKDVGRFVHYYPLGADLGYSSVPKGYQEALLFYWLMSKHTATDTIPWKIDPQTENRLREYAQIFTSARSADALSARFEIHIGFMQTLDKMEKIKYCFSMIGLLFLFAACQEKVTSPARVDTLPSIFPDYVGVTIPLPLPRLTSG